MRLILFLVFLHLAYNFSFSQSNKSFEWSFEGQIALVTNGKGCFVNFGGPGIKFKSNLLDVKLGMMPSLRFQKESPKPIVTPLLGFGPQFYLTKSKKLFLSFPIYYYASTYKWEFTGGIGYVITSIKKTKNESEH
jgi:hypothetical protein